MITFFTITELTNQFPEKTLSTLKSTKVFSELTLSIWNSVFHLYFWLKLLLSAQGSGHTRAKLMTEATRSGLFGLFFLAFLSFRANSASKLSQMSKNPPEIEIKRSEKWADHTLKSGNLQYSTLGCWVNCLLGQASDGLKYYFDRLKIK